MLLAISSSVNDQESGFYCCRRDKQAVSVSCICYGCFRVQRAGTATPILRSSSLLEWAPVDRAAHGSLIFSSCTRAHTVASMESYTPAGFTRAALLQWQQQRRRLVPKSCSTYLVDSDIWSLHNRLSLLFKTPLNLHLVYEI